MKKCRIRAIHGLGILTTLMFGCSGESAETADMESFLATPFIANVNFEEPTNTTPSGYVGDKGAVFGPRGNGLSYGWNMNMASSTRKRGALYSSDERYNTLIYMPGATWEMAVPNGSYKVRIVAGDPDHFNGAYKIDVEGQRVVDGSPSYSKRWVEGSREVSVHDGKLTISNGAGAQYNRICFIDITGTTTSSGSNGSGGSGGSSAGTGGAGAGTGGSGSGTGSAGTASAGTGATSSPLTPADPGARDVLFEIRTNRAVKPISPLIYGTNGAKDVAQNRQGMVRLGGNRWTAYNWENNASNAGSDYLYQNDGYLSSSNTPGDAVKVGVDQASSVGAATLVTVPIVDYVAADKNGGGDVRNSGSNYLSTRFKQNRPTKGSGFATPNAADNYVYQDEFVSWLKTNRPNARIFFSLDNEPDLWSDTHPEIHPKNVGYDELCERNVTYAKSIKSVWPDAKVTGSVNYGWYGFVALQDAPDAAGKGEFLDYYLARMKNAEAQHGKRLVDFLDLHWYPEATGGGVRITTADGSSAVAEARMQAPRSLWDANYKETSWVANSAGGAIRLIPRVKSKIAANYPGTGLAVTEWNFGGGGHISGAIATADVLGIFGREGVDMAHFWPLNSNESFAYAAFRAFRNFDGAGSAFGDISVEAVTSDAANYSVYASVDTKRPGQIVIVAINKSSSDKTAGMKISHASSLANARVYRLTAGGGAQVQAAASIGAVGTNAFSYRMPAQSVSVIVLGS